ncbi:MAG TPA: YigZ family protein [Candidatus Fimivicinus intestinavium]|nr:YigZ family protein [Candidatus Fimivicinus intestinavium]
MDEYRTLRAFASDEFTEKRSRFIGFAQPVATIEEAGAWIDSIRAQHRDATHNVFAYLLRSGQLERYSDDGEPQGTAGIPVLDVLRKRGVTNCAVVVTRYFGGVLLGAGGLVRAYSHAASLALDAAGLVTMAHCVILKIACDYSFYGKLAAYIPEWGGIVEDTQFGADVTVRVRIRAEREAFFCETLFDASNGRFHAEHTGDCFAAAD